MNTPPQFLNGNRYGIRFKLPLEGCARDASSPSPKLGDGLRDFSHQSCISNKTRVSWSVKCIPDPVAVSVKGTGAQRNLGVFGSVKGPDQKSQISRSSGKDICCCETFLCQGNIQASPVNEIETP